MIQVRDSYKTLAKYLQSNLPFSFDVLSSLDFLGISNGEKLNEHHVSDMAVRLPNVIPGGEIDQLRTEVRVFNMVADDERPSQMETDKAWQIIRSSGKFPLLCRLAAACCSIFHSNADVERFFGKLHDILGNVKRHSLNGE